ncbi:flagellar basal body-associated FliL family protein [Serpentinicella sp. ANB-PHB4]|uniref:flagellar basal body-associated FliL family protein n=1 Tax=Serpentinicella sp. ANB-PHB4 TaxID=3074076 RepID=UPI00285AA002|nr:flagellar basal body-associated FliL family protein [Serpentinicella sp. ANB-PHB4]MDR5658259.1 flagellar basal body-associated FliL family protein [Serpentinicella sp. ANB-PHB4]
MEKKKIIIVIVSAIILSAIFFSTVAYFLLRSPNEGETSAKPISTYEFNIGSFTTNLSGTRSFIKAEIVIETSDRRLLSVMEENDSKIRDRVINTFLDKEPDEISDSEGQIDLKNELIREISLIINTDKITNIYFNEFIIQ